ncbi:MAG: protein-disulfide isomerase [Alcanivoracaceae bacterium]|uniref:DsbC family protein n=1 Tax=Alcanivorax sp. MD8A TaxID=1177157 RepID=UPI000C4B0022|nr:DsbC family protein [Alcanivorax sp. MD8A]MAX55225.1 protein-disulfide isomerase [Alcanivoracaceae bacterium]MCG8438063.1 DsbC family protein [Pseudomonadales bacterium]MEE2870188.1 DsbC family protein [Pseudomonadota bacterium]PNE02231.1 protein disulfide-isomerase [Alcanivorax sp. MD8A]|tara:strand:- start:600 stop:1370 length:771 start_codon:yes stop_codon:yes gene_type:complete
MKKWFVIALVGLVTACGADSGATDNGSAKTGEAGADVAKAAFEKVFTRGKVTEVRETQMPGVLELTINGSDTLYMSDDGRFLFNGTMLELRDGEVIDPVEERLAKVRGAGIKKLDESELITYEAEDEKYEVYVFTDITCGYCRKLHRHIEEFQQEGVTVHYLAFPRGGESSPATEPMRHIWCADDPKQALTDAKLSETLSEAELKDDCAGLVMEQYELGLEFGVRGTPAIYTAEGKQLGGYITPEDMLSRLGASGS